MGNNTDLVLSAIDQVIETSGLEKRFSVAGKNTYATGTIKRIHLPYWLVDAGQSSLPFTNGIITRLSEERPYIITYSTRCYGIPQATRLAKLLQTKKCRGLILLDDTSAFVLEVLIKQFKFARKEKEGVLRTRKGGIVRVHRPDTHHTPMTSVMRFELREGGNTKAYRLFGVRTNLSPS